MEPTPPLILPALEAVKRIPHKRFDHAQLPLFYGQRGFGKTTAMRWYVEVREPRVVCFDPFDDFKGLLQVPDLDTLFYDMARYPTACRRRVIPDPGDDSMAFAEEFFGRAVHEMRNSLIMLDEVTLWSGMRMSTRFRKILLQGRRWGFRMAVACQRISLVPGDLLSEVSDLLIFHSPRRPLDLDILEDWTDKETREASRRLDVGSAILVRD